MLIFTKSEMAANRVMKSISSWLERKLFLKVNATKTEVVRPTRSKVANSRLEWYRRSGMNVVNFIISKDLLENRIKDRVGLLNPLSYFLFLG